MHEAFNSAAISFLALFPILNPPAMSPVFWEMTSSFSEHDRKKTAFLVGKYSFYLLASVFLFGSWLMKILGISIPVIRISGGLILFNTAWKMLSETEKKEKKSYGDLKIKNAFYPITLPVTAGPGSIAVTLSLAPKESLYSVQIIFSSLGTVLGIFAASFTIFFFYRFSQEIIKKMDTQMKDALTKISAFILLAIAVQITSDGVLAILKT
ncbi:MAG: MarC family protein [Elusimicrobia bacterium]|nr:MarC family protein [Elusimicrobiota bacterium]